MICTYATQKEKLMRRQNECECEKQNKLRTGVNEVHMCRSKCDARAKVKMQSPCAGQNEMHMRRTK